MGCLKIIVFILFVNLTNQFKNLSVSINNCFSDMSHYYLDFT